jgi:hypothetical protein
VQRLPSGYEPHADLEAVLADAAYVALSEVGTPVSNMTLSRGTSDRQADRFRGIDVERCASRLCDEGIAVEEPRDVAVALDGERAVERRRKPERDLDLGRIDERRKPPAGIASVRRRERPTETVRERDLHAGSVVR